MLDSFSKILLVILFFLGVHTALFAQDIGEKKDFTNHVLKYNFQNVRLMVVPNFSSYKKIKDKIENDANYQVVLQEISKVFEDHGFIVLDFMESLKISEEKYQLRENKNQSTFSILLENAPADIFIYVDISLNKFDEQKQVNLYLKAVDKYTAERYVSSSRLQSTKRYWDDFQKPAMEALHANDALENFIEKFETKLLTLFELGRKIDLNFESTDIKNISLQMFTEEDKTLIDVINEWIENNSIYSTITIGNSNQVLRKEVYIPILNNHENFYSPADFGNELAKYLNIYFRKKNIKVEEILSRTIRGRVEIWFH